MISPLQHAREKEREEERRGEVLANTELPAGRWQERKQKREVPVNFNRVFRCDWCGRFYSSPLPEGSACPDHIPEHNARLAADIARFNARLVAQVGQP